MSTAWPLRIVIDGIPAVLTEPACVLPDGRLGWWQRGQDCGQATVATLTQMSYDEVGQLLTLAELADWCERRGLEACIFPDPDPRQLGDWIGLFVPEGYDEYHAFVARGAELVHDPACGAVLFDPVKGPSRVPPVTQAELESAELAITIRPCPDRRSPVPYGDRRLGVMRSGLNVPITIAPVDRSGQPLGPTTFASQTDQTKWSVVDLGQIQVESRASGQEAVPTQFVQLIAGGASGASVVASPALQVAGLAYVPIDLSPGLLRTGGAQAPALVLSDLFHVGDLPVDLDGRAASGGVWLRLGGRFNAAQPGGGAGNIHPASAGGSALYSLASGALYTDLSAQITLNALSSAAASGQVVELWSKAQPASQVATIGVRAKLVLGPSAALSLALLSHDGTGTTLHASVGLGASAASALYGQQYMTLTLQTLGAEGRVWLGTAPMAGSPLLNPSSAKLAIAGNPMLGAGAGAIGPNGNPGPQLYAFQAQQLGGSAPDTDARDWFRFQADPQERAIQSNASVYRYDRQHEFRGIAPRVAPVGSPAPTGPAQLVVLTGEVDNFLGNDAFDVRLDVRERFSFMR